MHQLSALDSSSFLFSVNTHGVDRTWNNRTLNNRFETKRGSIEDLQATIKAGNALCTGVIRGRRLKENFQESSLLMVDFDHNWTLTEALNDSLVAHATIVYTTLSHQKRDNGDRFRVVFRLPEAISDIELYEAVILEVLAEFPAHDPSCKDAVRVFYGNSEAQFPLVNAESRLPQRFLKQARKALTDKVAHATNKQQVEFAPQDELDAELVRKALQCIPPRDPGSNTYNDTIKVLMALHDRFGEDGAKAFIDDWSPGNRDWKPNYKLQTFRRNGITIATLFYIAKKHGFNVKEETKRLKVELDRGTRLEETQRELSTLRITPTEIHPSFFPVGHLPQRGGLAIIDGPMGSGKTSNQLTSIVQEYRTLHPEGKILSPGLRNLLLQQNARVLGIEHIEKLKELKGAVEKSDSIAYCWDSAWRITPQSLPKGTLMLLDEAELGFLHLLSSDTISSSDRPFILKQTKAVFESVINGGGYIVAAQYGITNIALEFLYDLCGKKVPTEFIKSEKKGTGSRSYSVYSSPLAVWEQIKLNHSRNPKEALIACSDAPKWLRKTEQWLIQELEFDAARVWVIDSDSSEEAWAKSFATDPDTWIKENNPQALLFSPSIQMGVSITEPAFENLYFNLIHLEPRASIQLPDRYRVDCPRHGYIRPSGNSNGSDSYLPEEILANFFIRAEGVAKITGIAEHLQSEGEGDLIPLLGELENGSREEYTFWLRHLARYQARANYEKSKLRETIIRWWKESGHKVYEIENAKSNLSEVSDAIAEKLERDASIQFASKCTEGMALGEASDILHTLGSTKQERQTARKTLLEDRYPGVDFNDPETVLKLVIKNRGGYLKSTQLLWAMNNPKSAAVLDRKGLTSRLKSAHQRGGIIWLPTIRTESLKADLLNRMPLAECIQDSEYSVKSEKLKRLREWSLFNSREIKRVLRLQIKQSHSSVDVFNKFARRLGYHPMAIRREGPRGKQIRIWLLVDFHDIDRTAVLEAIQKRFERPEADEGAAPVATDCPSGGSKRDVTTTSNSVRSDLTDLSVEDGACGFVDEILHVVETQNREAALCYVEYMFEQTTQFENSVFSRVESSVVEQLIQLAA